MAKVLEEIPVEYLIAIGEVTVRWNRLEMSINTLLIHWLGKDINERRSHVIFTHMSFPQKLDVMGSLVEELVKDPKYNHLKACKSKVIPLLREAQSGRNMVIHSMWGVKDGTVMKASITARGLLKLSWTIGRLEEIEKTKRLIDKMDEILIALVSGKLLP